MSAFIIILGYILCAFEFIWFFTCTKHKKIPLISVILFFIISCIPGLNVAMSIINVFSITILLTSECMELKDNWFNRKFLALNE